MKLLEDLQKKITSENELEWLDDFVAAGGAEWLIEVLTSSIHKPSEYVFFFWTSLFIIYLLPCYLL